MIFSLHFLFVTTQKKHDSALLGASHSVSFQLNELRDEWRRLHNIPDGHQPQPGQVGFFNDKYNYKAVIYLPGHGAKVSLAL